MYTKKEKRKRITRRFIAVAILAAGALLLFSCGGEKRNSSEIIEEMVIYHGYYGDEAGDKTEKLLKELRSADPEAAAKWESIMELWDNVDDNISISYDVLPDGLPDTDELCMVALGFQLNPDGSMREELKERLKVVKKSAEKYPHTYMVCTGGGTSSNNKSVTEAGKMAEWLIAQGIDKNRIIVEDKSMTTAQNAVNSLAVLKEKYPQVSKLAIISSDYHIATGTLLFGAEAVLTAEEAGKEAFTVVSNAAYKAPFGSLSSKFQAGALIELSGDIETAYDIYYNEYDIHELPTP